MLILMGCDKAQGYGLAKPMPAVTFIDWLNDYSPNNQWLFCGSKQRNNKESSIEIFTMISEQWKEKFKNKVMSSPNNITQWPMLDNQYCQCGNWIKQKKQEQLFDINELQKLEKEHNKIHRFAQTVKSQYDSGKIKESRANLAKLDLAFKEMKMQLRNLKT